MIQTRPEPRNRSRRARRIALVHEQSVDGRTGAAHVCAERPFGEQLFGERRRREVVRRQRGEVGRAADRVERREQAQRGAPRIRAGVVEARRRRALSTASARRRRQDEHDPVVLRQVERLEVDAPPRRELRPVGEEERDIGAELCRERVQPFARERLRQAARSRARAPRQRRSCRLRDRPRRGCASRSARASDRPFPRSTDRARVARACRRRNPVTHVLGRGLDLDSVREIDALQDGRDLVVAVVARGPTTSARLIFALADARIIERLRERDELRRLERLGAHVGGSGRASATQLPRARARRRRSEPASSGASCGDGRSRPRPRA